MSKALAFEMSQDYPVAVGDLWDWHMRPGAFGRLSPPCQRLELKELPQPMHAGARVEFHLRMAGLRLPWRGHIAEVAAPDYFVDVADKAPFPYWRHCHRMLATGPTTSRLLDEVEYRLPLSMQRLSFMAKRAHKEMQRLFVFRHRRLREDLQRWGGGKPGAGKVVLVTGLTGMVGRRLEPYLQTLGFEVRGLSRRPTGEREFFWDPARNEMDAAALKGVHGIVHLAGENIASGRWTESRKQRILNSRVAGTRLLVETIGKQTERPEVFVSASGINAYAPQTDGSPLAEDSPRGDGFLSEVCAQWEGAAMQAQDLGMRTVILRSGVVLDPVGGALAKMLPVYQMGLGGPIGSGKQAFPWISSDDLLDMFTTALLASDWKGAYNAVAPQLIAQREFNAALGRVLRRPAVLPLPAALVRLIFGQMGQETLLANLPAYPERALKAGFRFRNNEISEYLGFILGKKDFC